MSIAHKVPAYFEPEARRSLDAHHAIPLQERLIAALDVPTVDDARRLIRTLGDSVNFYKIGMELQFAGGIALTSELIDAGKKVFLDSKLFDIDETIEKAVRSIAPLGVHFLTVHGNGPTIRAAVKGREESNSNLRILSVTVLTSLDVRDMQDLGFECSIEELVLHRSKKALEAGADGVIASGREARKIRDLVGDHLTIVTPGIRPFGSSNDDQARVATPAEAIAAGADYLVVGRPITRADDPRAAADAIVAEIDAALHA